MDYLEVYDLQYRKLGVLNDNTVGSAKGIEENHTTNQISTLTFEMPLLSDKWVLVANENLVKWRDEYYFIKNPNFEHSKDKKKVKVQCSHLSSSLQNNMVTEINEIARSAEQLAKLMLGYKAMYDVDGVWTGFFDEAIPPTTGWRIGSVNMSSPSTLRSVEIKEVSAFQGLVKVAELFYATLNFNSSLRTVDMTDIPINRNIQIRVGTNLKSVSVSYDSSELITRLYPFGGNGDAGEISILGAIDKDGNEVTKSYLEDYSYFLAKDSTLTMDYINAHPELFLRELTWREGVTTDPQTLYDEAMQKMTTISKPVVKCNINGLDLSVFPEYFLFSPKLNEIVTVYDEDLDLSYTTQVTSITKNCDNPLSIRIETSNEIEYSSILKKLVDTSSMITRTLTPIGEVKSEFLQGVINLMKAKLGSTESNYTGVCSDDHGNLLIENVEKTKAMKIGGGIFAIASQRLADGSDYDWQTFGDGDGFVASLITAGVLVGGKIQFNLDEGTFLIGNSATDYQMYFDGTNLRLGGGVSISWGSITDVPPDLGGGGSYTDEQAVQAWRNTYIDANNVYTGNVYAGSINGGEISGCTLKTVPATQTDSYIKMYQQYIDFVDSTGTSVFKMGIGIEGAEAGKPQLFLGSGCSIDTFEGCARFRAKDHQLNRTNYLRINEAWVTSSGTVFDGGGIDYVIGNKTYQICTKDGLVGGGTTGGGVPVFG